MRAHASSGIAITRSRLHTQGEDLDDAVENAEGALALYVEGLREEGESLEFGVIRRRFPLPA